MKLKIAKNRSWRIGAFMLLCCVAAIIGFLLAKHNVNVEKSSAKNIMKSEMVATTTTPTPIATATMVAITTPQPTEEPQYKVVTKKKLLAEHSISNSNSYSSRNVNMSIACSTISGLIFQPGEVFKWSEVVGATTKKKGYLEAGVIVNKQSSVGLGGGVCQVSSTLYSAVYDAGIIKKGKYHAEKHTLPSSYIDPNVDHEATVAVDQEPIRDFWFENTLDNPILIRAKTKNGTVTVKIFELKEKKIRIN